MIVISSPTLRLSGPILAACLPPGGCAAQSERAGLASAALDRTEQDLAAAERAGFVWRVKDPAFDADDVYLAGLLDRARTLARRGQVNEPLRLARRVIHATRGGLRQTRAARDAVPHYPLRP